MAPALRPVYKTVDDCTICADIYVPAKSTTDVSNGKDRCPVALIIHGGAFMLGHSGMVSLDQVGDMQERGWIVVSPEHRLCPQVDILEGPITDIRDCLDWVYNGGLERELANSDTTSRFAVDHDRVVAVGTSSGGTMALALGFDVKRPVHAILDFYGAINFTHTFWTSPLANEKAPAVTKEYMNQVYEEKPVPIKGGVSLEGQAEPGKPPPLTPRAAFAFTQISNGTVLSACFPSGQFEKVDACLSMHKNFPPTCIVHGTADTKVPKYLSEVLYEAMKEKGVKCEFIEVPGEEHTFVGQMKKGSRTWDLQRQGFDFLEKEIGRQI